MQHSIPPLFRRLLFTAVGLFALCLGAAAQPRIGLVNFADNFQRPVDIRHCGDSRLFITEQRGVIWVVDSTGARLGTPFLDIDAKVNSNGNEQGLLGLAFHPNYAQNGLFYVNYIRTGSAHTRISRFKVSTGNPNVADPASEQVMIDITQPFSNHNGGGMKFGPDGMLYIATGDGGSGGDPQDNGQKKATLLGKMLRLDVNNNNAPYYTIPADNPFVGNAEFLPEIWALGLRNPWRFSFDRLTGDMWIGDVGQNKVEEIDFEPANSPGGLNYGWRCYEGNTAFNTSGCQPFSAYEPPIFDYQQSIANGCSVTGGFVYRGAKYPELYGKYIFTDFCSGRFWALQRIDNTGVVVTTLNTIQPQEYSSFGEDYKGELYIAALSSGKILRVTDACANFAISAAIAPATCNGAANGSITLTTAGATGNVSYTWNGQPGTAVLSGLNPGIYTVRASDANQCVRLDTFVVAAVDTPTPVLEIAPGQQASICDGNTVLLQAQPNPFSFAYQWFLDGQLLPGISGPTYTAPEGGLYTARMVNGVCLYPLSNTLLLDQVPTPEITLGAGSNPLCIDSSATLLATIAPPAAGGFSYQWYNNGAALTGATTPFLNTNMPGEYSVQWINITTGCNSPKAEVFLLDGYIIIPPEFGLVGDTIFADPNFLPIEWYFNGVLIPNQTGAVLPVSVPGTYTALMSYGTGCKIALSADYTISTRQPASVLSAQLTPNPAQEAALLDLRLSNTQPVRMVLNDAQGRLVQEARATGAQITHRFDLTKLAAGTYFVHIHLEDGVFVRELVKM